jgi:hypothetical protein
MTDVMYPELSYLTVGAALEVHRRLGTGFLEAIYERALVHELFLREIPFSRQVTFQVAYKGITVREVSCRSCSGWQAHCRDQSLIHPDPRAPGPSSELSQSNGPPPGNSVQLRKRVIGSKAHCPLAISCNSCNSWQTDAFQHLGDDAYHHFRQYGQIFMDIEISGSH